MGLSDRADPNLALCPNLGTYFKKGSANPERVPGMEQAGSGVLGEEVKKGLPPSSARRPRAMGCHSGVLSPECQGELPVARLAPLFTWRALGWGASFMQSRPI